MPRAGGARGQPDGGDHRQPERQERGKREVCIDPHGYLAKDWECLNRKALAFLRLASIRLMLRKL